MKTSRISLLGIVFFIINLVFFTFYIHKPVEAEPTSTIKDCYSTFMTHASGGNYTMYTVVDCGPCTATTCYGYEDPGRCHNYFKPDIN